MNKCFYYPIGLYAFSNTNYIHLMAFTKAVPNGGNITQNHSGLINRNATIPTNDKKAYIQYFPVDSEVEVILFVIFVLIFEFNAAKVMVSQEIFYKFF